MEPASSPSTQKIRLLTVMLLVLSVIATTFVTALIWAIIMKQYSKSFRIWLFVLSGVVGNFLLLLAAAVSASSQSHTAGQVLLPLIFVTTLAPFAYSLVKPLPGQEVA